MKLSLLLLILLAVLSDFVPDMSVSVRPLTIEYYRLKTFDSINEESGGTGPKPTITRHYSASYDNRGRILKAHDVCTKTPSRSVNQTTHDYRYQYNNDGLLSQKTVTGMTNGQVAPVQQYTFGYQSGRLIKQAMVKLNTSEFATASYTYDGQGNLTGFYEESNAGKRRITYKNGIAMRYWINNQELYRLANGAIGGRAGVGQYTDFYDLQGRHIRYESPLSSGRNRTIIETSFVENKDPLVTFYEQLVILNSADSQAGFDDIRHQGFPVVRPLDGEKGLVNTRYETVRMPNGNRDLKSEEAFRYTYDAAGLVTAVTRTKVQYEGIRAVKGWTTTMRFTYQHFEEN